MRGGGGGEKGDKESEREGRQPLTVNFNLLLHHACKEQSGLYSFTVTDM